MYTDDTLLRYQIAKNIDYFRCKIAIKVDRIRYRANIFVNIDGQHGVGNKGDQIECEFQYKIDAVKTKCHRHGQGADIGKVLKSFNLTLIKSNKIVIQLLPKDRF